VSYSPVNIELKARGPLATPLAGVVVKVLDLPGKFVLGQVTSDDAGVAALLLPAPASYQVRFYKFGVSFPGALRIDVKEYPEINDFSVLGEPYVYPTSLDPRLCIASGVFRNPSGGVAAGIDMHFIGKFDPILLDGSPVLPERVIARTDLKGYVEVPLIRFAKYDVTLQGMEDYQREISVPDAGSVPIGDLLFPVVESVVFDPADVFTVAIGDDVLLHPHVFASDLRELDSAVSDLLWSTSDSTGLGLDPQPGGVVIHGFRAGTYTLTAVRKDPSIVRLPNTPVQGVPVQVVVTT